MPDPVEDADVETSSEGYARRFAGPVGAFFLEVQARATLELLAPWPRASVLDVGGGHGQLTGPLVDAGYDVTVYRQLAGLRGPRACRGPRPARRASRPGDLLKTPFADRSFDVVLSYRLLPHVVRWPELIGELSRLAARGGRRGLPHVRGASTRWPTRSSASRSGVEGDTRPFTVFRDDEVERRLRGARASSRPGAGPQFFVPMALHRALALGRGSRGASKGSRRGSGSPGPSARRSS